MSEQKVIHTTKTGHELTVTEFVQLGQRGVILTADMVAGEDGAGLMGSCEGLSLPENAGLAALKAFGVEV